MYLSRIEIENIRGFGSGDLKVDLDLSRPDGSHAGWTVLAGRNGSGKSTLLRSIALAVAAPSRLILQPSFVGWLQAGADLGRIVATIVADPEVDDFLVRKQRGGDRFGLTLRLDQMDAGPEPEFAYSSPVALVVTETPKAERPWTIERVGPWAPNPQGWFIAGYGPHRRLTGSLEGPRATSGPPHVSRLASLFREEASLVESIQWLKEHHLRRLEEKPGAKELVESVLTLLNDGLLPDSTRVSKIDSDGLWVKQGKLSFPLNDMSDGYRTTAALVLDLARQLQMTYQEFKLVQQNGTWCVPYPGVVLIDEVELHLHVSWQRRIGFWLKRHFPNIQFIVTTHSPFVCQAADPKGLIRLPAPGEERTAEHVSEDLFRTVVNGSVDEAVLTELFGLEHVHSEESEKLRTRVAALEVRLMDGKATEEERAEFERLSAQLPDTGSALVDRAVRSLGLDK